MAARESDTDMGEADGGDALRRSWSQCRVRLEGAKCRRIVYFRFGFSDWIQAWHDLGFLIGFRPEMI